MADEAVVDAARAGLHGGAARLDLGRGLGGRVAEAVEQRGGAGRDQRGVRDGEQPSGHAARELTPAPEPARPRIVAVLPIGGTPVDAVFADGTLWATDFAGSLVQVDPAARRVTRRIELPGSPGPLTTDREGVWVQTAGMHCEGSLVRIDAVSGRIVGRTRAAYPSEQEGVIAAAGGGAVWVKRGCASREGVDRLDVTGAVSARATLGSVDGLTAAGDNLWAIGHDGTLTQIDRAGGRIVQRWRGLAPLADPNTRGTKVLAGDDAGVWVLSTGSAEIRRVEGGRVVRRIPVDASARPLVAKAPDGLWIAVAARLEGRNRLVRIDPATSELTGVLELGNRLPVAIVPVGDELCVLTADGTIVFIRS